MKHQSRRRWGEGWKEGGRKVRGREGGRKKEEKREKRGKEGDRGGGFYRGESIHEVLLLAHGVQ